jgi:hypothetical protein
MQLYNKPTLPVGTEVVNLVPEGLGGTELTPKTRVVIINRSAHPYHDKHDGRDYIVLPGLSEVEYEAADHFRSRSVVPGTRDPITGKQEHFIAILGIDPEERCVPLTEGEQLQADEAPEAIDRTSMSGADRDVKVVSTQAARSRTAGGGTRRVRQSVEGNDGSAAPAGATAPIVGGDAARTIQRETAEAEAERA